MTGRLEANDLFFRDAHGRAVILRGFNFVNDQKTPPERPTQHAASFWDEGEAGSTSFVPSVRLDDGSADVHLRRLRSWGFNCLRYLFTWEAIEHAGPCVPADQSQLRLGIPRTYRRGATPRQGTRLPRRDGSPPGPRASALTSSRASAAATVHHTGRCSLAASTRATLARHSPRSCTTSGRAQRTQSQRPCHACSGRLTTSASRPRPCLCSSLAAAHTHHAACSTT